MKQALKKLMAATAALALAFSLAACGSTGSSSTAPGSTPATGDGNGTAAPAEGGSIRVWVSSGAEDDVYRQMFAEMEERLGIEISDEYYPKEELDSKLQVAPVVGDAPDMLVIDYLNIPGLDEIGLIEDVQNRLSSELRGDMLQSVLDEGTYDGRLLAIAQFDAGMGMWANKSMLEAADIRIPTSYTDAWDKAEFEDALAKLKANGVDYPLYIRQNKPSSLYFTFMPVIASFGGDYLDADTLTADGVLNSEGTIAALDYVTWLIDEGYMNPACDYEDAFYGRQESALSLLGHWKYSDHVNELGDDAIIIPVPDFGAGVYTCSGSVVWAMTTAATENGTADLVWQVMEDGLTDYNINMVTDFNGAIPSRKSVIETKEEMQEGGRLYLYREQLEAGISVLRPLTPAHMTIYSAMESVFADVIAGADARTSLEEATEYIDDIILDNGWNVG